MAIELKNVTFTYPGGFTANRNVSLTIPDGGRLAIIGQNGAGKTTLVKLMNGLNKPTAGDVVVDGVDTRDKTTAQISRYVGYVFQNPDDQIFNKDVITEIEYMPRYFKLTQEEIKRRRERAVELTGVGEYLKKSPFDIPYPMRKFVTIAAVLAAEPKYLILDEPTAGQDRRGMDILTGLMERLGSEGVGIITITHDMEFAAANFTRIVVMAQAEIIGEGAPRDIFWNDEITCGAAVKKPQLGELAEALELPGRLLYRREIVDAIQ